MAETPAPTSSKFASSPMFTLGLMMAGASTVDALTMKMLPITAKHFTDNITLISWMVALNRICGLLIQPYAAWKSDSHLGRGGRRRPFLMLGWPVVFFSVALLGAFPFIVPADQLHAVWVIVAVFLVNLVMQAGLDFCYGSGDPMYGDTFSAGDLGRATGIRMGVTAIVSIGMGFAFVPLADVNEFWPYAGSMFFVAVSFCVACFALREKIPAQLPAPSRYNPLKPLAELRDPRIRNIAICGSAVLMSAALTDMLHALFVTETLGFSKAVMSGTETAASMVGLAMAYPVGWWVDRWGARRVMMIGFSLVAVVEASFVLWVSDLTSLIVGLIAFKASWVIVHLPMVPLMFQDTPLERRGAIFAAVQTARAAAASVAIVIAGELTDIFGSYRVCYLVAGVVCVIGFVGAYRLAPLAKNRGALPVLA